MPKWSILTQQSIGEDGIFVPWDATWQSLFSSTRTTIIMTLKFMFQLRLQVQLLFNLYIRVIENLLFFSAATIDKFKI